jgi:hypothetical protein
MFKNNEYLYNFYNKDLNSNTTIFNLFNKSGKKESNLYITNLDFNFILNKFKNDKILF